MKQVRSFKRTIAIHLILLCVGPTIILAAGALGVGLLDGFSERDTNQFAWVLTSGLLISIIVPFLIVIHEIFLVAARFKQNKYLLILPVCSALLAFFLLYSSTFISSRLSLYVDCNVAKEDNPIKCGFKE